jgi:hypothetical protein
MQFEIENECVLCIVVIFFVDIVKGVKDSWKRVYWSTIDETIVLMFFEEGIFPRTATFYFLEHKSLKIIPLHIHHTLSQLIINFLNSLHPTQPVESLVATGLNKNILFSFSDVYKNKLDFWVDEAKLFDKFVGSL